MKGWKVFWIICSLLIVIGIGSCITAIALGVNIHSTDWKMYYGKGANNWKESIKEEVPEVPVLGAIPVQENVMREMTDIKKLEIEVYAINLLIKEYDGNEIQVEKENVEEKWNLRWKQESTTFKMQTDEIFFPQTTGKTGSVTIYIPKGILFREVEIAVGAGKVEIENIYADEMQLNLGAGYMNVNHFKARELEVNCGAGEVILRGEVEKEIDINTGLGQTKLYINGVEEDFGYEIACGLGQVTIGTQRFTGITDTRKRREGAIKWLDIECGIGSVEIKFQ